MAAGLVAAVARPRVGVSVSCGVALLSALAAYFVYSGLISAGGRPVTPPVFVVGDIVAVVTVAGCAFLLSARGHSRMAGWLTAFALSLAAYLVAVAAGFALGSQGDLTARLVVAAEGAWWVVVLTMSALIAVVAVEELDGARDSRSSRSRHPVCS